MTRWCAFALLWGLSGCEEDLLISQQREKFEQWKSLGKRWCFGASCGDCRFNRLRAVGGLGRLNASELVLSRSWI